MIKYKIERLAVIPDDFEFTKYYNKAGGLHIGHVYHDIADYPYLILRDNDMKEYLAKRVDL